MVTKTDVVSTSSSKDSTTSKTVSSTSTKASSSSTPTSTSSTPSSALSSTLSSTKSTSSATSTSNATSTSTATSQCYGMLSNTVSVANWVPCGSPNTTTPYVPCCASGDYCLADGLCHYTHSANGGSGYYAGGCTDPTWKDSAACPHLCDDRTVRDVVWNATSALWNCCGANAANGNAQCNAPTDETFNAPAPAALQTYYQAGASHAATHHAAAHAGLSAGAAAGIGVACGIAGVAVLGGLAWMVWRRRRAARGPGGGAAPYKYDAAEMATDANAWPPSELASAGAAPGAAEPKDEDAVPPAQSGPVELPAEPIVERGRSVAESAEGERPGSDRAAVSPVSSSGERRPDLPDSLRIRVPGSS